HCYVLVSGFCGFLHVGNELLVAYGRVGAMGFARKVFYDMCIGINFVGYVDMSRCSTPASMVRRLRIGYIYNGACHAFRGRKRQQALQLVPLLELCSYFKMAL
ncbi:hypothetical protein Tco_1396971, partial [Tanacetum coccineum]